MNGKSGGSVLLVGAVRDLNETKNRIMNEWKGLEVKICNIGNALKLKHPPDKKAVRFEKILCYPTAEKATDLLVHLTKHLEWGRKEPPRSKWDRSVFVLPKGVDEASLPDQKKWWSVRKVDDLPKNKADWSHFVVDAEVVADFDANLLQKLTARKVVADTVFWDEKLFARLAVLDAACVRVLA